MWPLVMYSNYFEIVSTVIFLDLRTELISGTYVSVILYLNQNTHGVKKVAAKN